MAKHFSELICWQLARELRREVFALISKASFNRNFDLRDQLGSAASSVCSNISEGFGRLAHRDFHRFLEVSRTSVNEVEDRLGEAVEQRLLTTVEIVTGPQPVQADTRGDKSADEITTESPRPQEEALAAP